MPKALARIRTCNHKGSYFIIINRKPRRRIHYRLCIVTLSSSRSTLCLFEFVGWFTPLLLWKLYATPPCLQLCASPYENKSRAQSHSNVHKLVQYTLVHCLLLVLWFLQSLHLTVELEIQLPEQPSQPPASRYECMCTGIMRQRPTHRTWHSRRSYSGLPGMLLPLSCWRSLAITCMHYWDLCRTQHQACIRMC